MSDTYANLVNHGLGKKVAGQLGLPRPATLRRYEKGQPLLEAPAAVGAVAGGVCGATATAILRATGAEVLEAQPATEYTSKLGAVVLDATAARKIEDLEALRATLAPAVKALGKNGRVVILGSTPSEMADPEAAAVQQALEGIMRSIGKEARLGGTANLIWLDPQAQGDAALLASPLRFFCSSRSAYVSGQPVRLRDAQVPETDDWASPFIGQTVVVTGAARGIGAQIARVYARAGAHVIAVDIPAAGQALTEVANSISGTALQLDITAADAPTRIAEAVARQGEGLDVLVHNAGITRDKLFVNTDADRWGSVLNVNLAAQLRINAVLLDPATRGGLKDGARVVSVASTSGIGGNRGQANYAASKAGVMGLVRQLALQVADRRITVNAVAPGFIETEMTSKIPLGTREVGRRINSMLQGGQPVDVGEAIAWLSEPSSAGITGQVLRVCGQSQLGA